ncbi:hypothetical protein [Desulfopila sp. IMCC35008]|uniref:tetratricopeptide repeat protein n=1 Tax=Desulfopila sp. IMCC35008 TaxID=2653858 RepID=UPI0013D83F1F|nr:hypothetical protein [Desulfopila sp. IMCC35008]
MLKKVFKFLLYSLGFILIISTVFIVAVVFFFPDIEEEVAQPGSEISIDSTEGSTYHHQPSGWRFKIPAGWLLQDAALAQQSYEQSKNFIESSTGQSIRQSAKPSGDLALIHSPGNTLNYKYQAYDQKRFPAFEQAATFVYQTLSEAYKKSAEQDGTKAVIERSKTRIGHIDFDTLNVSILDPQTQNVLLRNMSYVADIKGLMAMITFTCVSEDLCSAVETAVISSSYETTETLAASPSIETVETTSTSSSFEQAPSDVSVLYNKAINELRENNAAEAFDLATQAIEIDPNIAILYIVRADAASRIQGQSATYFSDLDKAESLEPQLPDIYWLRGVVAKSAGDTVGDYYYYLKSNLFQKLQQNGTPLPRYMIGMTEKEYLSTDGEEGYVQSGVDLNFQVMLPIPITGENADVVFKKMEIVDEAGTIKCSDNLPVGDENYRITASNLITAFEDSSGQFYQLYYRVKFIRE